MKKNLLLCLFLFVEIAYSQTLLMEENFNYGNTATDLVSASSSVWTNHSGGTLTDDVQYLTSGLNYAGYPSSGIGGSASVLNSRTGDDNRIFSAQSTGSVYLSALVNVNSATTSSSGEYFLHFGAGTFYGRLYVRNSSSNLQFGISKFSEGATFSATNFSFGTAYLIVIKYTFVAGVQNDRVDLWVITSGVPETEAEAGTPTIENVTALNNDASSISAIALRQGSSPVSATIDGIRIADSWSQAPLPVELSSFSAIVLDNAIKLNWRTETEVSNYGFEVERAETNPKSEIQNLQFEKIGFVNGHGNSNSPKNYSYLDDKITGGKYSYRLKQIDTDGKFEYSKVIEVDLNSPVKFELSQNYPNPFNPSTTIKYSLPVSGYVRLSIYNLLGEKVADLVTEFQEAGIYTINFNAMELNSGVYVYNLESNGIIHSRKMILVK